MIKLNYKSVQDCLTHSERYSFTLTFGTVELVESVESVELVELVELGKTFEDIIC